MSKQVLFIPVIALCLFVANPMHAQQLPDSILLSAGKAVELESEVLSQTRKVLIHHPIFFDQDQEYPLIVLLDGEMAFKSFSSITELMGFQELIPHCIVVGITNIDRNGDYAPVIEGYPESGRADLMIEFYEKELLPYLEASYHFSDRILWGHSFVGMFSSYVMFTNPGLFNGYISTSPSLRFVGDQINALDFKEVFKEQNTFFYFSYGSLEDPGEAAGIFVDRLKAEAPENLDWHYKINENKNHDSNAIHSYLEALELYFRSNN